MHTCIHTCTHTYTHRGVYITCLPRSAMFMARLVTNAAIGFFVSRLPLLRTLKLFLCCCGDGKTKYFALWIFRTFLFHYKEQFLNNMPFFLHYLHNVLKFNSYPSCLTHSVLLCCFVFRNFSLGCATLPNVAADCDCSLDPGCSVL